MLIRVAVGAPAGRRVGRPQGRWLHLASDFVLQGVHGRCRGAQRRNIRPARALYAPDVSPVKRHVRKTQREGSHSLQRGRLVDPGLGPDGLIHQGLLQAVRSSNQALVSYAVS